MIGPVVEFTTGCTASIIFLGNENVDKNEQQCSAGCGFIGPTVLFLIPFFLLLFSNIQVLLIQIKPGSVPLDV